jgi:hypothetical protein
LALFSATDWELHTFPVDPSMPQPRRGFLGFCYEASQQQGSYLSFPIWCPVILFVTAAAAPCVRRFSLRTLLIATMLVAVVLGLIVYLKHRPPTAPPLDHVDAPEF